MSQLSENNAILVLSNLPDQASAKRLAQLLVEQNLAACVNILAECSSIYRWQGKVETATEVPMMIKTTANRYQAVEAAILANHPYDVPEIIQIPITNGLPAYLHWLNESVSI